MTVAFTVLGKPEPAGSKRAFTNPKTGRVQVVDANRHAAPWKQQVAGAARGVLTEAPLLTGPLSLTVVFFVKRPRGHFGTGRNANVLKPSAPRYPAVKPDATKLVRAVEDALTGVIYRDDAQVVDQYVAKRYGTPERCEVRVEDTLALDIEEAA
jgi:Holliday junction resolvase RusA-like endonuclease